MWRDLARSMLAPPVRRLSIDFKRTGERVVSPIMLIALIAGVLALVPVTYRNYVLARDLEAKVQELSALDRVRPTRSTEAVKRVDDRLRRQFLRANAILRELHTPWDELFSAIETSGDARVGLLSLETNPRKREVAVVAEAKTVAAMFAYIEKLQSIPVFSRVELQTHEVQSRGVTQPVRFRLVCSWHLNS